VCRLPLATAASRRRSPSALHTNYILMVKKQCKIFEKKCKNVKKLNISKIKKIKPINNG
jgi:hypothetical protein